MGKGNGEHYNKILKQRIEITMEPIEEKEIKSEVMDNELRDEPEQQDPIIDRQPPQINMLRGSEEITLKHNGVELSISSCRIGVDVLASIVLSIYNELKGQKPEEKNGGYLG